MATLPYPTSTDHLLITIPFSHYNEKARWAFDYYSIPYAEQRVMPGLHRYSTRPYVTPTSRGKKNSLSTPYSTPMLVVKPHLKPPYTIHDSSDITRYAATSFSSHSALPARIDGIQRMPDLYLSCGLELEPRVLQLERRFSDGNCLGIHSRRWAYYQILCRDKDLAIWRVMAARSNVGWLQRLMWWFMYPKIAHILCTFMMINEASAKSSETAIIAEFEYVSTLITPESPFLAGKAFSAADITFAVLAAPALGIGEKEGYGSWSPKKEVFHKDAQEFMERLRQTPAGKHVLRMYREYRGRKAIGCRNARQWGGLW
ncbi:hypothetical protein BC936DRAFT_140469 [Jimgerdemannia flammicorona]|uniref:GST C-terminal domain-containing protein n=1 Tax=Jimgerdemannia flammicorona TaxID=994334 RepID=A0A433AU20_9FUNG|nr:hypothetical protein BC936DRAFT_140469 [Jimgerdemannia flammicorona]